MDSLRIACAQLDIVPGRCRDNLRNMEGLIHTAAEAKAQLVVFPELSTTDYYVRDFTSLANHIPGEHSNFLSLAASRNKISVAAGLLERDREGIYNTTIIISKEGRIIGKSRKTHLSVDTRGGSIAKETDVFLPGEDLPVFATHLGIIGMMICKDGEYPEVPRVLAVKGAEIILWMTNRAFVDTRAAAHYAASNCVVLLVANRAKGRADGGKSVIFDWEGNIRSEAGQAQKIIHAEFDMKSMRKARISHWHNRRIRRPELYEVLGDTEAAPSSL